MNQSGNLSPQPVTENIASSAPSPPNSKSVRYSLYINIALDAAIGAALVGFYVWILFHSGGPDGGFAAILGIFYVALAVIPIADGYILFRSSRRIARKRLWTYFATTRSITLLAIAYSFYQYAAYDSTLENNLAVTYTIGIIVTAILFSSTGIIIYRTVKGRWQLALLMAVAVASLLASGYFNAAIGHSEGSGSSGGLAGTRRDNQTARDFQLLSQDVENYALQSNKFPATLQQALDDPNSYSSQADAASRLSRYTYKYDNSKGTFDLCATFATDTTKSGRGGAGVTKAYNHKTGYQCFPFEITGWTQSQSSTPGAPSSSSHTQQSQDQGVQVYNLGP